MPKILAILSDMAMGLAIRGGFFRIFFAVIFVLFFVTQGK